MTIVTIEIDDDVLADFYESIGISLNEEWKQEEIDMWLENVYLKPHIHRSLLEAGQNVRKEKIRQRIENEVEQTERDLRNKVSLMEEKYIDSMPDDIKKRIAVDEPTVVEDSLIESASKRI